MSMPSFSFTASNLLTVIIGLISVLGTVFAFDAERLISGQADMVKQQAADHTQITNSQSAIIALANGQSVIMDRLNDHDIRIVKLENNPAIIEGSETQRLNLHQAHKGH